MGSFFLSSFDRSERERKRREATSSLVFHLRPPSRSFLSPSLSPPKNKIPKVPALNIFESSLKRGKFDANRTLSDGSMMEFEHILPMDAGEIPSTFPFVPWPDELFCSGPQTHNKKNQSSHHSILPSQSSTPPPTSPRISPATSATPQRPGRASRSRSARPTSRRPSEGRRSTSSCTRWPTGPRSPSRCSRRRATDTWRRCRRRRTRTCRCCSASALS